MKFKDWLKEDYPSVLDPKHVLYGDFDHIPMAKKTNRVNVNQANVNQANVPTGVWQNGMRRNSKSFAVRIRELEEKLERLKAEYLQKKNYGS